MITVVAIGKKHEAWIQPGLERYEKRLKQPWNVEWVLLPHSALEGVGARQEESERILKRLGSDHFVILLDERGRRLDSPAFSRLIESSHTYGKKLAVIIGGAYGVTDELHQKADMVVSLSNMVFPHQLVRLLLVEQLYRAQSIATGSKYHHE
mgnify:CR=1 FL=1